ncbi:hypothetical protein AZZ74_003868, partial [Klebsiella pneumoniae]
DDNNLIIPQSANIKMVFDLVYIFH